MAIAGLVREAIAKLRLKLLDLSNRNRLLNFKFSDSSTKFVRVIDEIPGLLYERLTGEGGASGRMYFVSLPEPPPEDALPHVDQLLGQGGLLEQDASGQRPFLRRTGQRAANERIDLGFWARENGIDPSYDLPRLHAEKARRNHTDNKIQTLLLQDKLTVKMAKIRDDAKLSEQEQGVSTLYAAFGFLEWYEEASSKEAQFAPLLLLPVQIDRELKNHRYSYFVECGEAADPSTNISLRERLKKDFGFGLPELGEEEGPEEYMATIEKAIHNLPRWKVRRYVVIGHFSFSRLAMYQDLDPAGWASAPLEEQPLIQELLAGAEVGSESAYAEDYDIEKPEIEALVPTLLMDSDSSQFSAIVDAMKGRSFALKGPPGTGKSQTITNLIASALATGKTVLFVAEKLAALEVVSKRLADAHLDPFILELHSTKNQKKRVAQAFETRLNIRPSRQPEPLGLEGDLKELARTRARLHHYAKLLNGLVGASGLTLHEVLWREQSCRNGLNERESALSATPLAPDPSRESPSGVAASRSALRQFIASLDGCATNFHKLSAHALYGIWRVGMQPRDQARLRQCLARSQDALSSLSSVLGRLGTSLHISIGSDLASARKFCEQLSALPRAATLKTDLLKWIATGEDATRVATALSLARRASPIFDRLLATMADPYGRLKSARDQSNDATRLRSLVTELGWVDIRLSDLPAAIESEKQKLTHLRGVLEILNAWAEQIGYSAPLPVGRLSYIVRAVRFLHETPAEVLRLRHNSLYRPDARAAIALAAERASTLRMVKEALSKEARVTYEENPAELLAAADRIENAGLVSRTLSGKYRAAVRLYRALSHSKWNRAEAPAHLRVWARAIADYQKFVQDPECAASIGPAFSGLETPFETLFGVVDYWRTVRANWPALDRDGAGTQQALLYADASLLEDVSSSISVESAELLEKLYQSVKKRGSESAEAFVGAHKAMLQEVALKHSELEAMKFHQNPTVAEIESSCAELDVGASLHAQLTGCDVADLVVPRGQIATPNELQVLEETLAFGEKVRRSELPGRAIELLMSAKAPQAVAALGQYASLIINALASVDFAYKELRGIAELNATEWLRDEPLHNVTLVRQQARVKAAMDANPEDYAAWAILCDARKQLIDAGARSLVEGLLDTSIRPEVAERCLERMYLRSLILSVGEVVPEFHGWTGTQMEQLRGRLAELDRLFIKKSTAGLIRKVSSIPVPVGISRGPKGALSERSLIENEVGKQTRHVPIRSLLARACNAAQAMKPCFMMSPASVSQFLPRLPQKFDLMIIDEASQMRPEDALGALARAKQIVVVGDPMQLPPTTFFDSVQENGTDDDEDEDLGVDTESVLDLALAKFRPPRDLRWHYRSRHESLIAFSNHQFYQDRLIVFPSPTAKAKDLGVQLVHVPYGSYRASLNQKEAEVVIQTVRRLVHENPRRSIGVIAVNQPQRDLLTEEFDRLFAEDQVMEDYRARWGGTLEEFFVNNLENVQGHERDVIVISTVYGPETPGGPIFQRFGPINSRVGHRRLNVLFTRAKELLLTVTSMAAEDIKVTPASPLGVIALKQFLEFARSGRLESGRPTGGGHESPFEAEVDEVLTQLGYRSVPQVGVAGFFIDLAVCHPAMSEHYVLGIECDGASYHSAKSARDRDRLRQEILERLGWKLHRIWSTDWYRGRDREIERLRRAVGDAVEAHRAAC